MPEINDLSHQLMRAIQVEHRISKYFMYNLFDNLKQLPKQSDELAKSHQLLKQNQTYLVQWSIGLNPANRKLWHHAINTIHHQNGDTLDENDYETIFIELVLAMDDGLKFAYVQKKLSHFDWNSNQIDFYPNLTTKNVFLKYYYRNSKIYENIYLNLIQNQSK